MALEPGIADIPELINDFVQAGLPVTLGTDGEPGLVSAAVGLALYRITQESLANIANTPRPPKRKWIWRFRRLRRSPPGC